MQSFQQELPILGTIVIGFLKLVIPVLRFNLDFGWKEVMKITGQSTSNWSF